MGNTPAPPENPTLALQSPHLGSAMQAGELAFGDIFVSSPSALLFALLGWGPGSIKEAKGLIYAPRNNNE